MHYTKENINEYLKCSTDVKYFAENYIYVSNILGRQKIKLNPFQCEAIEKFNSSNSFVKHEKRQSGKTVIAAILLLHSAIFDDSRKIGISGPNMSASVQILEIIRDMSRDIPSFIMPKILKLSKTEIILANETIILAIGNTVGKIRGMAFNCIYIDEIEYIRDHDEVILGICRTNSTDNSKVFSFSSIPSCELIGY